MMAVKKNEKSLQLCIWLFLIFCGSGCIGLQSLEKDRQLGLQYREQLARDVGFVNDPLLLKLVSNVGKDLLAHSPDKHFDYSYLILDMEEPNAIALPGGIICISRGMLAICNNSHELANIIGHEIGHVRKRHTAKRLAGARLPHLFSLPGLIVGKLLSPALGSILRLPFEGTGSILMAHHSREQEYDADYIGQKLAYTAGYDPRAQVTNLIKLSKHEAAADKRRSRFLNTHPSTQDRIDRAGYNAHAYELPSDPGKPEAAYVKLMDGLIIGPNPSHGHFDKNLFLQPHLDFALRFPENWQYRHSNSMVAGISKKEDAFIYMWRDAKESNLEQAASETIEKIKTETGLVPVEDKGSGKAAIHWRYLRYHVERLGADSSIQIMWALIAGQRYKLTAVGPVREMEDMKASLVSLRPLTDTERKSFYVERLALAQLKEGESLDAFNERTANIWSVRKTVYMNGLYESRKPEAGRWLKLARRYPYKVVNNNEQK